MTGAGCRYEQSTEAGSGDEDYGVMCPPRRPRQDWRLRTETQERPGSESPGVTAHHTHLRCEGVRPEAAEASRRDSGNE